MVALEKLFSRSAKRFGQTTGAILSIQFSSFIFAVLSRFVFTVCSFVFYFSILRKFLTIFATRYVAKTQRRPIRRDRCASLRRPCASSRSTFAAKWTRFSRPRRFFPDDRQRLHSPPLVGVHVAPRLHTQAWIVIRRSVEKESLGHPPSRKTRKSREPKSPLDFAHERYTARGAGPAIRTGTQQILQIPIASRS